MTRHFYSVPGHSTGDIKNRKAFKKQKQQQNSQRYKRTDYTNISNQSKHKVFYSAVEQKINSYLRRPVAILLFGCAAIVCSWLYFNQISDVYTPPVEKQLTYDHYVEFGNFNLAYNDLNLAQQHFMCALEMNKKEKAAYIGLTEVLAKQCLTKNKFCKEAEDYLAYLEKSNYLNQDKVDFWKTALAAK